MRTTIISFELFLLGCEWLLLNYIIIEQKLGYLHNNLGEEGFVNNQPS